MNQIAEIIDVIDEIFVHLDALDIQQANSFEILQREMHADEAKRLTILMNEKLKEAGLKDMASNSILLYLHEYLWLDIPRQNYLFSAGAALDAYKHSLTAKLAVSH